MDQDEYIHSNLIRGMWYFLASASDLRETVRWMQPRSVEFCCEGVPDYKCQKQRLHHTMIKFFEEPLLFTLPDIFSTFANLKQDLMWACRVCWLSCLGVLQDKITTILNLDPQKWTVQFPYSSLCCSIPGRFEWLCVCTLLVARRK